MRDARATDGYRRFFFFLALWSWSPVDTVFDLADELCGELDKLSDVEWSTVLDWIPSAAYLSAMRSGRKRKMTRPVPSGISRRLASLIALKDQAAYGRQMFLEYLSSDDADRHSAVVEFRQYAALEAALGKAFDWKSALRIIRKTYTQEAAYHIMALTTTRSKNPLPDDVAYQILESPNDYPMALWEMAESAASASARKAVRPVAQTARKDRWFVD